TVLITGSNRGLGFAFAKHYTNAGWSVIATSRKGSDSYIREDIFELHSDAVGKLSPFSRVYHPLRVPATGNPE
ncbi:hypothetical protein F443_02310, partial [Phytophthora nicotianae P1569]